MTTVLSLGLSELPAGVQRQPTRRADGTTKYYYYWRATRAKLPDPSDPGFEAAVAAASTVRIGLKASPEGTLAWVIDSYRRTQKFLKVTPGTKRQYDRYFATMKKMWGEVAVGTIRRHVIEEQRDEFAISRGPAAANDFVKVLSVVMNHAIRKEKREGNPCTLIDKLPTGTYKAWSEEQLAHALATFPEQYARAILLAVHTVQREGDVLKMRWSQYDGAGISLTQEKTMTPLWVPLAKDFIPILNSWKAEGRGPTILVSRRGGPYSPANFRVYMARLLHADPVMKGCVFHGLRKLGCVRLAQTGCSEREIMAISGHTTAESVAIYLKDINQRQLAISAKEREARGTAERAASLGLKVLTGGVEKAA